MAGEKLIHPVEVERDERGGLILEPGDDTRLLDSFGPEAEERLHVHRLGDILFVTSDGNPLTQGLVRYKSPHSEEYAAMMAEAGPNGVGHHPV